MKTVKLMETTLRDGSYAINFSFTASDTAIICKKLENAGFEYVEIGHGVGLNASNCGYGQAVATDEEYMAAAEGALKKAKYGMFCIPGIARLEDLETAGKHDMGFVRVGTNVTQVRESEKFIRKAKDLGMFVAANYMKSYALSPDKFAENVALSEKYGADVVYIVDSSGGMFPEDIRKYYEAIRKVSSIDVGFHGHNNLGLAIANSLEAADLGAAIVDCSLQGLGRSSGNAATEIMVAALIKKGYRVPVDLMAVMEMGQEYIRPLLGTAGNMPLDIVAGFADFHSSYMPHILKCAAKHKINPLLLIIEITKADKVNLDEKVLEEVAKRIKKEEQLYFSEYGFNRYVGGEQDER